MPRISKSFHLLSCAASLLLILNACSTPSPTSPGTAYPQASGSPSAFPSSQPTTAPTPAATGTPADLPSQAPSLQPSPSPSAETAPPEILDLRANFFQNYGVNPFVEAATDPLSTFATDVDTAAYTIARGYLNRNQLPPAASVRTEEYLNYFNYHYPQPLSGKFAIYTDLAPAYFGDADNRLLRVGIQGREILDRNRKNAVLTLVIDVSGSMNRDNRLSLVKQSLKLLLDNLRPSDRVGLVVYGTDARVLLPHTSVSNKALILSAIDNLRPEGSTNAEAGLSLGYAEASKAFVDQAINRVILCSDGVANVGETGPEQILARIQTETAKGISLTALGFGMGDYNDSLMEQLANQGDGNYAYIDTLDEARKVLDEQVTSTLQLLAKDAKIQVAFNPELVEQYRLLGYENRDIADEDFRNDAVDAGEIGSNHSVTALYELRFKPEATSGTVATVNFRYQDVDAANRVVELSHAVSSSDLISFSNASGSLRLATAVAEFAEILRESVFAQGGNLNEVLNLAQTAQAAYSDDLRIQEFVGLVQQAAALKQPSAVLSADALLEKSKNPARLPAWESYLLKQLGGQRTQP
ncbi:MAG: VWA domain-containing protein [Candidatus Melainabacteria bacterium HGW-Melainabacteria-1]|nr:MAG: VWA domain-containing protein [Candidatus Melainabacteria bacterium HGW-Melainabacteria-1]